jgi:phosphate acetyltransferase
LSFLAALPGRVPRGTRIAFPESAEPRTAAAIDRLRSEGRVHPVAVVDGDGGDPEARIGTADPAARAAALEAWPELAPPGAGDELRFAVALLRAGRVDGVVAGAEATTADVLRAGLRVLGPAEGIRTVSSAFYMVLPPDGAEPERVLTFTDAAVVPAPDPEQLAEIAEAACRARARVVGDEPRVAFLSYATRGSAAGASVERVREGLERFRARRPDVRADGELQADAALVPEVAARKAPGSPVEGRANVLVFPDLDAGNIAYKLVQRLGRARALGPILQGLSAPLNDLSRGASADDIVEVTYITALLAGEPAARVASENRTRRKAE